MRFVELKSQEQLDIQTLHRVRSRLVAERTNLLNQLRAILLERGVIFPAGRRRFELDLDCMLSEGNETHMGTLSVKLIIASRHSFKKSGRVPWDSLNLR
ncbi:transposase [Rhizobium paranaense]|uniref:Transposase n=1 Tax=Rhizobium paranaense TaxID=1650438 RepID=A0A7W8XX67_9HYPH|nr:transposase [Rhizobium paranaense]